MVAPLFVHVPGPPGPPPWPRPGGRSCTTQHLTVPVIGLVTQTWWSAYAGPAVVSTTVAVATTHATTKPARLITAGYMSCSHSERVSERPSASRNRSPAPSPDRAA